MGQFKNVGDCFLTLAEECNELSQAILKKYRFGGEWDDSVEGTGKMRKILVMEEMEDVLYQMQRCYHKFGLRFSISLDSIDDDVDPIDDSDSRLLADEMEYERMRLQELEQAEREMDELDMDMTGPDSVYEEKSHEYIVASTVMNGEHGIFETMLFEGNERGDIVNFMDLGCINSLGDINWSNHSIVMNMIMGDDVYEEVRDLGRTDTSYRSLWKKKGM